jgi:predicted RNA-binding protein with PUA-like domain
MRKGDLAFFYHSNCAVPGIVGVMRIAEEHSVDESAFDPTHPYYDEKSNREKPKWDCVKVEFVKKFQSIITLKELKSTPELSDMQIAKKAYGRLSVQTVTSDQWQFVLKMANEPEDLGVASTVSGYEADTNGETDKEMVEDSIGADDVDMDVDAKKIAAYGDLSDVSEDDDEVDMQLNGAIGLGVNQEVQAEKERVEAIDTFAREIASGGEV